MLVPFQVATSSRTLVVCSETSETWPPMIPAMPEGPLLSQTRTVSASKAALDVVERLHLLAVGGGADRQRAVRDLVEVEGVQRLRGQQHHVVGDVDDVVDRPLAGRGQPRLQPGRRGGDRDVGEDAGGEARAEIRHLDRDRGVVADVALALRRRVLGPRLRRQRRGADRVDLAGDAVDAEAVDPVRRHLQLQHRLGDRQHLGKRRAGREAVVLEHEDAGAAPPPARARRRRRSSRPTRPRAASPCRSCGRRAASLLAAPPEPSVPRRRWGRRRRSSARRRRCRPCRRAAGRRWGAARRSAPCRRRSPRPRAARSCRPARPRSRSSPAARPARPARCRDRSTRAARSKGPS